MRPSFCKRERTRFWGSSRRDHVTLVYAVFEEAAREVRAPRADEPSDIDRK